MAGENNFLSRWSRRKSESKDPARAEPLVPVREAAAPAAVDPQPLPAERAPLPPVESLTPESDFSPFMSPEVDGDVRRQALKTLFSDPRFNTMDMMDVYVDDYSKPDPIPESWMGKLEQLSRLGDRAGRDREESERRKALAEAQEATLAQSLDATPESPALPGAVPARGEGAEPGLESDSPAPEIPVQMVGE